MQKKSGNAKVEGRVGGLLIYILSTLAVHFLMLSPRGVYRTSREPEVGVLVQPGRTQKCDVGILVRRYEPHSESTGTNISTIAINFQRITEN